MERLSDREAIELAIYRGLLGELHPTIRAIVADIQPTKVILIVFVTPLAGFDLGSFSEVVESEIDQRRPSALSRLPPIEVARRPAAEFVPGPGLLYDNPWADG